MDIVCIVCLDKFTPGAESSLLECGHMFHSNCLNNWFKCSTTCPKCRKPNQKLSPLFMDFQMAECSTCAVILQEKDALYARFQSQQATIVELTKSESELKGQLSESKKELELMKGILVEKNNEIAKFKVRAQSPVAIRGPYNLRPQIKKVLKTNGTSRTISKRVRNQQNVVVDGERIVTRSVSKMLNTQNRLPK